MAEATAAGSNPTEPTALTGARAGADRVYMWGLALFLIAGVVQIFLAGFGVFDLGGADLMESDSFDPHRGLGFALGGVALVLFVLSLVARASTRTIVLSLALLLLASFMQSLLAGFADAIPFFGGLHALNGLVILGLAGFLHVEAHRRSHG